ncbi:glycoside hydrolase [Paenibacillus wulumuqiensis]|uniref:glycoside hydrolase n=1 Tax=Paenibacillus wulumuqiensis TaxID=1567107 RepID=UPI001F1E0943|nr:glycoside hydrolase [Paenibacillus wulumuqiensis]
MMRNVHGNKTRFLPRLGALSLSVMLFSGMASGAGAAAEDSSDTLAAKGNPQTDVQQITINGQQRYQEIDGFGASGAWSIDHIGSEWSEKNKNKVADLLFSQDKGIGLSIWRFNIGAGSVDTDQNIISDPWRRAESFKSGEDQPYDWSRQAGQQWFLQAAKKRGVEETVAFVNSPPVWMTKNGHGQPDPSVGSTNLKEDYIDDYAVFLADVLEHFHKQKLGFDYISPINEPTWDWNRAGQEGNRYNIEDIKKVLIALDSELHKRGIDTEVDAIEAVEYLSLLDNDMYATYTGKAGSTYTSGNAGGAFEGKYSEYIKEMLGDPQIAGIIGNKMSAHSYWSDEAKPGDDRLVRLRELVRDNLDRYVQDAKFWMSEYCILGDRGPGRDLTMDTALDVAKVIHYDMVTTQASAWQWWLAVSKEDYKDGLVYTDYQNPGDTQSIIESKTLWALGNYSKFVRPGAQRIDLQGANDPNGLMGSAYYHNEDKQLSVVFVNSSNEAKTIHLDVTNLPGGKEIKQFKPYLTSEHADLKKQSTVSVKKDIIIPARSLMTLVGKN